MVHRGFLSQYMDDHLNAAVSSKVRELLDSNPGYELLICGHSLGGAIGNICALELARANPKTTCRLVTYGAPRVGNSNFAAALNAMANLDAWRVQNELDVVSRLPYTVMGYYHAGTHVWLRKGQIVVPGSFDTVRRKKLSYTAKLPVGSFAALGSGKQNGMSHLMDNAEYGYAPHLSNYNWSKFRAAVMAQRRSMPRESFRGPRGWVAMERGKSGRLVLDWVTTSALDKKPAGPTVVSRSSELTASTVARDAGHRPQTSATDATECPPAPRTPPAVRFAEQRQPCSRPPPNPPSEGKCTTLYDSLYDA